eukprot:CAMPEP_0170539148 /NCGR_PEP_ID=MMETSP0209-20121228/103743_1 /TAXON_ID=665100 ORGANISM="Litonotus pictus, Strain P1" /NCGR_SAMPLE_ID=MMETSP0209 /ASSEMBLY_ACC=CAM_ASM_000301 /LENGTH=1160 /DNA_ID=CAMNT_0010840993 /DNA_START=835 /DNA_END=4314 /DNA_ORIENTATION=+
MSPAEKKEYQIKEQKMSPAEKKEYQIKELKHFELISHGQTDADEYNDYKEFDLLLKAFEKLKFSSNDVKWIFKTVMGVLYLGNVHFENSEEDSEGKDPPGVTKESKNDLDISSALLGYGSSSDLIEVLTKRKMKDKLSGNEIVCINDLEMVYNYKNTIAKSVYSKMFDFIVKKINASIGVLNSNEKLKISDVEAQKVKQSPKEKMLYIGILDIFGFENFESNSFEQLCINYANERLQQFFNLNIFKQEQEEYAVEQIDYSSVEYKDNQEVVELIDGKSKSVFGLLDSQGILKTGNDYSFREDVYKFLSGRKGLGENHEGFIEIIHFAENVFYDVDGFLEKNMDQTNKDITSSLQGSTNKLIKTLFKKEKDISGKILSETLSSQFKKQLNDLLYTLSQSNPRYVKCIKPNDLKKPNIFQSVDVSCQLLNSGILEAVKIRKYGYSIRKIHRDFYQRYQKLFPQNEEFSSLDSTVNSSTTEIFKIESNPNSKYKDLCFAMIKYFSSPEDLEIINSKTIQVGLTKVFMKEVVKSFLENKLMKIKYIEHIQSAWKRHKIRVRIFQIRLLQRKVYYYFSRRKYVAWLKIVRRTSNLELVIKRIIFKNIARTEGKKAKLDKNSNDDANYNTISNFIPQIEEPRNTDSSYLITDQSKDDIKKMMNEISKKKRKTKGLNLGEFSGIDKELQSKIVNLQEEVIYLKKDKETLTSQVKKLNSEYSKIGLENEVLEEKLKLMKENINKLEDNEESNTKQEKQETSKLKKELSTKDSQIEILTLQLEESRKKADEISKANQTLKNLNLKQSKSLEEKVSELVLSNSDLTFKLKEANSKLEYVNQENMILKENIEKTNNTSSNNLGNVSDLSILEEENKKKEKEKKNLNKKIEEIKAFYDNEASNYRKEISLRDEKITEMMNQTVTLEEELEYLREQNSSFKEKENSNKQINEEIKSLRVFYENTINQKEEALEELKEEMDQKISNLEKLKLAYKQEIDNKDEELAKEREYLEEKLEEIMQLVEKNIQLKKENSLLEKQNENNNGDGLYKSKLEKDIKDKSNEIFLLQEKVDELKKVIGDMRAVISKKQTVIENKKRVTNLILESLKLKNKEIQFMDALKLMSSKTIEEEMKRTREAASSIFKEVNELTFNSDYSETDSEEEEEESEEEIEIDE